MIGPLFEVLVDFVEFTEKIGKICRVYKLYWMEHCLQILLCPLFLSSSFLKWILFVRIWKWFVSNQRRWTGCQVPTRPAFFPAAILARVSVYSTSPLLSPYLHLLRLCTTLSTVRGSKVAIGLENCHCLRECQNLRTSTLLFSFCTAAAEFCQFLTSYG